MKLRLFDRLYTVVKLRPEASVPEWAQGSFVSVTRTADELSVVVDERQVPDDLQAERGWRLLVVDGQIDFSEVGILASLAAPLAASRVSLFVISTFKTDYLLVKEEKLEQALDALRQAGHETEPAVG